MKSLEHKRVEALKSYDIVGTIGADKYNNLARLAAGLYNTPAAQINFINKRHQWSLASCGMEGKTIGREKSFCNETIKQDECLIIEDATKDSRFKDNVFVTDPPHIRFYAGVNIKSEEGFNVGTVCIIDWEPRQVSEGELTELRDIARQVERLLELRIKNRALEHKKAYLHSTVDVQIEVDPYNYVVVELIKDGQGNLLEKTNGKKISLDQLFISNKKRIYVDEWLRSTGPDSYPLQMEARLNLVGQEPSWYDITGTYRYGKVFMTAINIEQRKEYESHLEKERKFSKTIIESLPGLFVVIGEQGQVQIWNENVKNLFDVPPPPNSFKHFISWISSNTAATVWPDAYMSCSSGM